MRETVMGYNAYHPPVEELDLTTGTLSMDRESRWRVSLHNMEFIFQCKLKLFSKSIKPKHIHGHWGRQSKQYTRVLIG